MCSNGVDGDGNNLCNNAWGCRQVYTGSVGADSKFMEIYGDRDKCLSPCRALVWSGSFARLHISGMVSCLLYITVENIAVHSAN